MMLLAAVRPGWVGGGQRLYRQSAGAAVRPAKDCRDRCRSIWALAEIFASGTGLPSFLEPHGRGNVGNFPPTSRRGGGRGPRAAPPPPILSARHAANSFIERKSF